MRTTLLSLATLAGLCWLTAAPAALAVTRTSLVRPDNPVTKVYYYYHGHRYPYYWNHHYYNHRDWRHNRWNYY